MTRRAIWPVLCTTLMLVLSGCYVLPPSPPPAPPRYFGAATDEPNLSYYAPEPPPTPLVESVPAAPSFGAAWQPGHWAWNSRHWVWLTGRYAYPPASATTWIPGHWRQSAAGYVWLTGYWE